MFAAEWKAAERRFFDVEEKPYFRSDQMKK